jgi:hypothetical protein
MIKAAVGPADPASVSRSGMRARLTMKLMGIIVMLVLTVMTARSCSGSSASSPLDPTNLANNGIAGLCANQQAEEQASGDPDSNTPNTIASASGLTQAGASDPGGVQALEKALGGGTNASGALTCPTTTIDNSSFGGG